MRRPRSPLLLAALALALLPTLTSCRSGAVAGSAVPASSAPASAPVTATLEPSATPSAVSATTTPSASPSTAASGPLSASDQAAGLTSRKITNRAGGTLKTVPGTQKAPGRGKVYEVRVQVEAGLPIDGPVFAKFVLATLNDKRSWTENGTRTFARTDQGADADFSVVLASPQKSADMCEPLKTFGKLSCHEGDDAVLTMYRWVKGIPDYHGDVTGYRHYVVNHEVGHALGHGHQYCAGKGKLAPLMMQQTKGLLGCRPNPWPFPDA